MQKLQLYVRKYVRMYSYVRSYAKYAIIMEFYVSFLFSWLIVVSIGATVMSKLEELQKDAK